MPEMQDTYQPLTFPQVQASWELARSNDSFFKDMDLRTYSQFMNQKLGTKAYGAGDSNAFGQAVKNVSTGIDMSLEPLSKPVGDVGAAIGGLIGPRAEKIGRETGETLPRMGAGMALTLGGAAAEPFSGGTSTPLMLTGLGLLGLGTADVAAKTYTDTGSPVAGAVQGAINLAIPGVGRVGGKVVGGPASGWVLEGAKKTGLAELGAQGMGSLVKPLAEKAAGTAVGDVLGGLIKAGGEWAGATGSALGIQEIGSQAISKIATGSFYNPLDPEHLGQVIASTLPFAAFDAKRFYSTTKEFAKAQGIARDVSAMVEKANPQTRQPELFNPNPPDPSRPAAEAMFLPKDLEGGGTLFGTSTAEELNSQKPFGYKPFEGNTLPKSAVEAGMRKVIPKAELEILEGNGLKEFLADKKSVSLDELKAWVQENGPRVEIREAGQGTMNDEQRRFYELEHTIDSHPEKRQLNKFLTDLNPDDFAKLSPEAQKIATEYDSLNKIEKFKGVEQSHWQMVAPKPESSMPGYAEIAVVIPTKTAQERGVGPTGKPLAFGESPKFPSSHNFPPNTLGWSRGYMETLPSGEKVWHVVEVQSDWGQRQREQDSHHKEVRTRLEKEGKTPEEINEVISYRKRSSELRDDPLLRDHQRLVLKATIDHAVKQGATKIAISDGETAMMTEGHDQSAVQHRLDESHSRPEALKENLEDYVDQAKGMRLNYDTILPGIAKDLTGYEGERVRFGEHKMALNQGNEANFTDAPGQNAQDLKKYRDNLIFKNPDGTPKTDITAKVYPLDKLMAAQAKRQGFTFAGKDKLINSVLTELEKDGAGTAQLGQAVAALGELRKGETIQSLALREAQIDRMLREPGNPQALMESTQRFFTKLYQLKGESPERVAYLTRNAMLTAARFRGIDETTIARALPDREHSANFAMPPMGEFKRTFVGILGEQGWKKFEEHLGLKGMEEFAHRWVLGHELTHQAQFKALTSEQGLQAALGAPDPDNLRFYQRAWVEAKDMTPGDKGRAIDTLFRSVVPKAYADTASFIKWMGDRETAYAHPETGTTEFLADFTGLMSIAGKSARENVLFANSATINFVKGLYRDLTNIMSGVRDWFKATGDRATGDKVTAIHENLQRMLRTIDEAEHLVDTFLAMGQRATARSFEEPPAMSWSEVNAYAQKAESVGRAEGSPMFQDVVDDAAKVMVPIRALEGERMNPWHRLVPVTQLMLRTFPMLREALYLGRAFRSDVSENTLKLWTPFTVTRKGMFGEKQAIDHETIQKLGQTDSPVNRLINKVMLQQNAEQRTIWSESELKSRFPEFSSLKEQDRKLLLDSLPKFGQTAMSAAIMRIRANRQDVEGAMSRVLQANDKSMRQDEAFQLGAKVVRAAWDKQVPVGETTPIDLASAHQAEMELRARLPEPLLNKVLDAAEQNWAPHLDMQKQMLGADGKGKLWYAPEVRLGDWMLAWQEKDGKPQVVGYKNKKEYDAKSASLQQQQAAGKLKYLSGWNKTDVNDRFHGMNPEMIDAYIQADQRKLDSVLNAVADVADRETVDMIREEYKVGDGSTIVSTSPYMQQRMLVGGRETLNMVEGMIHYINATSNATAKRFVKTRQAVITNDPEMRANPNLQNVARDYLRNITDPPASEFTGLKNLIFWNYMGLNPSSLPIESMQQLSTLAPYLVDRGAGALDVYKRIFQAGTEVVKARANKGVYANEELNAAVQKAKRERTIDTGVAQELYAAEDIDFVNSRMMTTGSGKVQAARDLVAKPAYHMLKLARDFYGLATIFNSESAFVTSYKYAREALKHTPDEAARFAKDATDITMFGGGVANRPMALYGLGKAQGVGGLMYSLQGYTFNMLSFMAHQVKRSVMDSSLSPAEKLAARKAAGLMFGTQLVLGGVMGMPLVAGAVALVDQVFPEAQVKKHMREAFFNLAKDDEEMGHLIADGSMNGLFNALTPADVGSRFQLGNLMGVNPYNGFSWKNVVGPAGTMLENYVKAAQSGVRGDAKAVAEDLSPAGLKGLVRMVGNDGAIQDRMGNLVMDATPTEKTLMAVGFKPKRYNQALERKALLEQAEKVAQASAQDFHQTVADALAAGNSPLVQQLLYTRQQQEPGYDVQTGIRKAADLVQQRVTPYDPRRTGSVATGREASSILRLYPQGTTPSEVQRLQSSTNLQQASGVPIRPPGPQEYRRAGMMDRLMQANPTMTRATAAAILERMSPSGGRSSYLRFGEAGPTGQP